MQEASNNNRCLSPIICPLLFGNLTIYDLGVALGLEDLMEDPRTPYGVLLNVGVGYCALACVEKEAELPVSWRGISPTVSWDKEYGAGASIKVGELFGITREPKTWYTAIPTLIFGPMKANVSYQEGGNYRAVCGFEFML